MIRCSLRSSSFCVEFEQWLEQAPAALKSELVWRVQAFRIGSFVGHCALGDAKVLKAHVELVEVAVQIVRASGSIAANVAEGYSRRSRPERLRYYEYALGSANECKGWYLLSREVLGNDSVNARLAYLARVSQLLLVMIRNERVGIVGGSSRRIPGSSP